MKEEVKIRGEKRSIFRTTNLWTQQASLPDSDFGKHGTRNMEHGTVLYCEKPRCLNLMYRALEGIAKTASRRSRAVTPWRWLSLIWRFKLPSSIIFPSYRVRLDFENSWVTVAQAWSSGCGHINIPTKLLSSLLPKSEMSSKRAEGERFSAPLRSSHADIVSMIVFKTH